MMNSPRLKEKEVLAQGELISTALLHFYLRERKIANILLSAFDFMRTGPEGEPDLKYIEAKTAGAIGTISRHQPFLLLKGTSAKMLIMKRIT